MRHPIRVKCTNENLRAYGCFGTVVGTEQTDASMYEVKAGVLYDVVWNEFQEEGADEIDGSNLQVVSETTWRIEVVEQWLDEPLTKPIEPGPWMAYRLPWADVMPVDNIIILGDSDDAEQGGEK